MLIGVDPGPVTGVFAIEAVGGQVEYRFAQADPDTAVTLVLAWQTASDVLVIEDFVIGTKTGKANDQRAGQQTRNVLERLRPYATAVRTASQVKGWATDERLKAAGIHEKLQGMRHARDAARHALFHAVKSGVLVDPLSRDWKYKVI